MTKFSKSFVFVAAAMSLAGPTPAQAQAFPTKAITWILPFPPGGVTDPVARLVGQKVSESPPSR